MKPPPFDYHAPASLDEAVGLLAQYGYDAKILAGGQSLIPTMNFRLAQPAVLIDINRVAELSFIQPTREGGVRIGALARHAEVEHSRTVAAAQPLIHATMPFIAHPQIRNRGTFGGSIAHADPASELPAVLRTLGGRVQAHSKKGARWIEADDFFAGLFTTALEPEEVLTEVVFPPMPPHSGWGVLEVARRHGDYALVGVTALVTLDDAGVCQEARITYFGVGDGPMPAEEAAAALRGRKPLPAVIAEAARAAASEMQPNTDIHASSAFRKHLVGVLGERALTEAFARAGGER